MSTLLIHGTLEEVERKLIAVKRVIDDKKVNGYPLWSSYEQWEYVTRPDLGIVCPVCEPHNGQIYSGDILKQLFPYAEYYGYLWGSPRTHMPDLGRFYGKPCNCQIHLLNPAEAFEAQLHVDKQGAI